MEEVTSTDHPSPDVSEVLRIVETHAREIPLALGVESVRVYRFIQDRFRTSDDLREDSVFQFVFRSFYRLDNAGLGDNFKREYFRVFQEQRHVEVPDVATIVETLRSVPTLLHPESLQFSFASKMAATVNPELPLYDSFVADLFGFTPDSNGLPVRRIERFMIFYKQLSDIAREAARRPEIRDLIAEIDAYVGGWTDIRAAKQIDFIFWAAGRVEAAARKGGR